MNNSPFFIGLLAFLLVSCSAKIRNQVPDDEYKVIAYVNNWEDNWGPNFEKAHQITHINYAFANIADGQVIEGHQNDTENLKKLNNLKKVNEDLKILISVGGWTWSKNFSDAALTEASREKFSNSAVNFMLKHKIDGVDLDWEYPGQLGDNNVFREVDKQNFTQLLKRLREKLDSLPVQNENYLLTIATGASQNYLDHTNMKEAQVYLDFINIMTYDYYTGGSDRAGHHANLEISEHNQTSFKRSSVRAVHEHINAGIPAEKIVLGVPFYGRYWKGTNSENNGLYQIAKGKRGTYNYMAISDSIQTEQFSPYWDDSALAPYIWRESDSLFVSYENELSLEHKATFVKNKGLGGIMFWQFNGDNGVLLNAINMHLN